MPLDNLLDRRIPLAIATVFLLQAGTAIWWAATKDTEDRFQSERLGNLEQAAGKAADGNTQIVERLAQDLAAISRP